MLAEAINTVRNKFLSDVKMKVLPLLIICATCHALIAQETSLSGLYFYSHEVVKDKRTSLNLTANKAFNFREGFTLEFEANFRKGDGHYGYVFRMYGDQKNHIDLVSNLASESINFWLILKDRTLISYRWADIPDGGFDKWMKIKFHIDPHDSRISLSLNNNKKVVSFDSPPDLSDLNIVFGACNDAPFLNSDVSPMTLKNIRLYNSKKKLHRHWKLSKHGRKNVYDEVVNAPAAVLNPSWLIDRHIQWNHRQKIQFNNLAGVTQNKATGQVFFVGNQAAYIYSSGSGKFDTINYLDGAPLYCKNNQVFYNHYTNELWSYDFNKDYINKFDFVTRKWSQPDDDCFEPDFWHHIRFFSPLDSSLITFGGYGHYKYKSILNRFDPQTGAWNKLDLSKKIPPRYLSSSGFLNSNEILIFSGYGSKSGRQELSPEYYYDLYAVDLEDLSVDSLWSAENNSGFVPCCNLLFDQASSGFLTLLYNSAHFETSLKLAVFKLDSPEKQILAGAIPYRFLDTKSWCNLFLNKEDSELLTITVHDSEMNIYAMAYPPLLPEQIYQKEARFHALSKLWIYLSYFLLFMAIVFVVFRVRKNKVNNALPADQAHPVSYTPVSFGQPVPKQKISSIYLFGGFQAFDKTGKDITAHFTPTLKELFMLILLYSLKNGKGVSLQTLNETLWFDKPEDSARNNRNVNLSKLRSLLDEVGHIELFKESIFWKITLSEKVYCDYIEMLHLLERSQSQGILHENEIHRLLVVASSGKLLPDIENTWLDSYKSDFSNLLIDTLTLLAEQINAREFDPNLSCKIAECMLKYDIVNEEAIAIKCSALYNSGKKGFAKQAYDAFCREYKNLMEVEFSISFKELLKG